MLVLIMAEHFSISFEWRWKWYVGQNCTSFLMIFYLQYRTNFYKSKTTFSSRLNFSYSYVLILYLYFYLLLVLMLFHFYSDLSTLYNCFFSKTSDNMNRKLCRIYIAFFAAHCACGAISENNWLCQMKIKMWQMSTCVCRCLTKNDLMHAKR